MATGTSSDQKLQMLTIMGFKDVECTQEIGTFVAQVNPESFDRTLSFSSDTQKTNNKTGQKGEDVTAKGESYRFELVLDGTGIIDNDHRGDISGMIAQFHDIVARNTETEEGTKEGFEKREPNFLKLFYCNKLFRCTISSASIKYSLFSLDGKPLRARISCDFKSTGKPVKNDTNKDKGKVKKADDNKQPTKECICSCQCQVEVVNMCSANDYNSIHPSE